MWSSITRNSSSVRLEQPPVDGMEVRARAERITQLVGCRVQTLTRQRGQPRGIRFAIRERLQHAARTGAEQIGNETRELQMRFLQQTLQPVLQLDAIARDLMLPPHHCPPEALLRDPAQSSGSARRPRAASPTVRHPENRASAHEPLDSIAPAPDEGAGHGPASRIDDCGCQSRSSVSHTGRQYCAVDSITTSSTSCVTSQSASPRRSPGWSHLPPYKLVLAIDRDVRDHHCQHLLVYIDSRNSVRHGRSPGRSGERARPSLFRVAGYRRVPPGTQRRPIIRSIAHAGSAN